MEVQGTTVVGQWHAPKKVRRAAILVHGYNSCHREFGALPQHLAAAGTAALALDLRGHGASGGERGRVDLDRALADIDAATQWIKGRHGRIRVGLVGHSNGGALSLGYAARRDNVAALVCAHPVRRLFDELEDWKKPAFHLLGAVAKRQQRKGRTPGTIRDPARYERGYVDPQRAAAARNEGYLQERANLANYTYATTMDAAAWAVNVRCPVLGMTSRNDRAVDPEHIDEVLAAVPGVERFEHQGGHALFRDVDAEVCMDAVASFLEEHL